MIGLVYPLLQFSRPQLLLNFHLFVSSFYVSLCWLSQGAKELCKHRSSHVSSLEEK